MFREPLEGWRHASGTGRRIKVDWAEEIKDLLDVHDPQADRVAMVMDNRDAHAPASLYEAFEPPEARRSIERLERVNTPKHGSWPNIAELELNVLGRQCSGQRIPDKPTLPRDVAAWDTCRHADQAKVSWRVATADAGITR